MYVFLHLEEMALSFFQASLLAQMVKNPPAMQETQVQPLGQEDTLERAMAAYSGILAWRIPWTEELGGLQSMGSQRVRHNRETNYFTFTFLLFSKLSLWILYPNPCFMIITTMNNTKNSKLRLQKNHRARKSALISSPLAQILKTYPLLDGCICIYYTGHCMSLALLED